MDKIILNTIQAEGYDSLGLIIQDENASLADLLEAWQHYCDDETIFKKYASENYRICKGCELNCCKTAYLMPDLIAFRQICSFLDISHRDFIDNYVQKEKSALGLLRLRPDPCVFLKDNICTIYPLRSLMCRFYICSPIQPYTEQLIYSVASAGVAALHLFAQDSGLLDAVTSGGATSFDRLFLNMIEEYRGKKVVRLFMETETYKDIPLRHFLEEISAIYT